LREAGLDPKKAMKLGLYVDKRRKTVHPWNVEALKDFLRKLREHGIEV
jgi:large subunit ribosomal protein L13e